MRPAPYPTLFCPMADKNKVQVAYAAKEHAMDDVQMGMSVSKSALNFQASMSAALINGTIDKGAEMEQNMRSQGLAAEGIGSKVDVQA